MAGEGVGGVAGRGGLSFFVMVVLGDVLVMLNDGVGIAVVSCCGFNDTTDSFVLVVASYCVSTSVSNRRDCASREQQRD